MNEKYYLETDIDEIVQNLKKYKKKFSGKSFLISGANGFLGKYFIKTLIKLNEIIDKKITIYAIDIKFDNCDIYFNSRVKKIRQDINKIGNLRFKSDYVLHAAGIPSPKNYFKKPIDSLRTSTSCKLIITHSECRSSRIYYNNIKIFYTFSYTC